jgi:hypothetical protein
VSPESNAPDLDGGEERSGVFRVTGGDSSPALKVEEGIFDKMAELVEIPIVVALDFAVFPGRYDHLHVLLGGLFEDRVGVIPAISQQMFGRDPLHQE